MEVTPDTSGTFDYLLFSWQGNPLVTLAKGTSHSSLHLFFRRISSMRWIAVQQNKAVLY